MAKFVLRTPEGFRFRHRGIGFLEGETWLSAGKFFDSLSPKDQETVRNRIDHWLGGGVHDKYHHGFPNDKDHKDCYVFKFQSFRLYGFLCNPKADPDKNFRLCVLTESAEKHQWETERTILDRAMALTSDGEAKKAIAAVYGGAAGVKKPWIN